VQNIRCFGFCALRAGGNWNNGANAGPFALNSNNTASNANNNSGCRIVARRNFYFLLH